MKVYSWKTLIAALCALVFTLWKIFHFDGLPDLLWIGWGGYYFIEGLLVAFDKESYEKDQLRGVVGARERKRLFGKYAFVAHHGYLILLLMAAAVALVWEERAVWVVLALLIAAVAYAIWYRWYFTKHADLSELEE
ncbi:MAG: hypothetical protein IJ396_03870 [Oscillibacter sp.]|nr:hypothetical protein [Oscillibacter sp.]